MLHKVNALPARRCIMQPSRATSQSSLSLSHTLFLSFSIAIYALPPATPPLPTRTPHQQGHSGIAIQNHDHPLQLDTRLYSNRPKSISISISISTRASVTELFLMIENVNLYHLLDICRNTDKKIFQNFVKNDNAGSTIEVVVAIVAIVKS